jgi:hypothetical protein
VIHTAYLCPLLCGIWDHSNCSVFFSPGNLMMDMGNDFVDGAFGTIDQRGHLVP